MTEISLQENGERDSAVVIKRRFCHNFPLSIDRKTVPDLFLRRGADPVRRLAHPDKLFPRIRLTWLPSIVEVAKIETAPSLQFLGRNLHVIEHCINAKSPAPALFTLRAVYDALSMETDGINFDGIEKLGEFEQNSR